MTANPKEDESHFTPGGHLFSLFFSSGDIKQDPVTTAPFSPSPWYFTPSATWHGQPEKKRSCFFSLVDALSLPELLLVEISTAFLKGSLDPRQVYAGRGNWAFGL